MRKPLLILIIFLVGISAFAQNDDEFQTISGNTRTRVSGVGSMFMSFGQIGGEFAHLMGGGVGVIVNDFFFGGYGMGKTNTLSYQGEEDELDLTYGHGGLWLGYTFLHNKAIHPVFHVQMGWGLIGGKEKNAEFDGVLAYSNQVFVVTPTLEVEFNFSRFFKLGAGINYPLVYNIEPTSNYQASDFSKPALFLSFKFGWFK